MSVTLRQGLAGRVAGTLVATGLGLGVLTGCGNDSAGPESGASVQDIQEEPGAEQPLGEQSGTNAPAATEIGVDEARSYVGQTVTVSADVAEIINPQAFTLAGTDQPLLVITNQPNQVVAPDSAVAVTGTVRQAFDIAQVESEFGFNADDALFGEFDGQPYIVANNIDPTVAEPTEGN